jgi:hypothetical protein
LSSGIELKLNGTIFRNTCTNQNQIIMENLCVIYSQLDGQGKYYVVDFDTMQQKTLMEMEACAFRRLEQEQEMKALQIYEEKGDDAWRVIQGGDLRFYIAEIQARES